IFQARRALSRIAKNDRPKFLLEPTDSNPVLAYVRGSREEEAVVSVFNFDGKREHTVTVRLGASAASKEFRDILHPRHSFKAGPDGAITLALGPFEANVLIPDDDTPLPLFVTQLSPVHDAVVPPGRHTLS